MNSVFGSIRINNAAIIKFKINNNKIEILLVDDSEIIRKKLNLILKQIPVTIEECPNK